MLWWVGLQQGGSSRYHSACLLACLLACLFACLLACLPACLPALPVCLSSPSLLSCGQDYKARINSLSFHRAEDLVVTASDDDSIHLYNVHSGSQVKFVHSKKYGVSHISFTHSNDAVLHASTKVGPGAGAHLYERPQAARAHVRARARTHTHTHTHTQAELV